MKTNLLLIPFNRPHYLKQVLNKINLSDFKDVYAFIDGPRNKKEALILEKTKKLLKKHGIAKINIQKENLGINSAFETALNWFFSEVEEGIILEEDCIPDESFVSFATSMLEKYRNDLRIGMIGGSNLSPDDKNSYLFSHHFGIWGWASWRDRWGKYSKIQKKSDIKISFLDLFKFSGSFAGALALFTKFRRLTNPFMSFWDMNWVYTNVINDWLCIIPKKNLITNIGYLGNSSFKKTKFHDINTKEMKMESIKHPKIEVNKKYDKKIDRKYNLIPAIKSFIYQTINFRKFS